MTSPDSQESLSLTLRISGGIMGLTREISINGNQAEWKIPPRRKDASPNTPAVTQISDETVEELHQDLVDLKGLSPQPEYKRQGRTVMDGQSYALQVHSPVEMAIQASDHSGAPEAFYRLVSKIHTTAIPKR